MLSASAGFGWKEISPVIYGSLMEETLSHDERRKGGMHYTSIENIHKLIDPLFLDNLKQQVTDMELVWGEDYNGNLDYATSWFIKAAQ